MNDTPNDLTWVGPPPREPEANTFTDEDLKRLQEMGTVELERWIRGEIDMPSLYSLIARLEAAEECARVLDFHVVNKCSESDEHDESALGKWRKACGR